MALPWPRGPHFRLLHHLGREEEEMETLQPPEYALCPALCSAFPCFSLRWHHEVVSHLRTNILSVTSSASHAFCDSSTNVLSVSYTVTILFVRYYSYAKSVG